MAVKKENTAAIMKNTAGKKSPAKSDLSKFLSEVQQKAYEIYIARQKTGQSGNEMSDWLKAEKEIKSRYKI